MGKIIVDTDRCAELVQIGSKFVFKQEAEHALADLLELQELIENKIKEAKEMIAAAGCSLDPDFKGVIGENIKATFSFHGEKYTFSSSMKDELLSNGFLKSRTSEKVDSKAVDDYIKKYKTLPEGILFRERAKTISLKRTNVQNEVELQLTPTLDERTE